jgi:NAD(P)H-dependent FMN reductase
MKRSVVVLVVALVIALGLAAGTARATSQGMGAIARWKTMDTCAKQAQAAFPDFTPDANAKREAKLKDCLNANNLPPREPLAPPQPR